MTCVGILLLLDAAVRHRVPEGTFFLAVHCIIFQCFVFLHPNSTVAFSASIFYLRIVHVIHPRYYGNERSEDRR